MKSTTVIAAVRCLLCCLLLSQGLGIAQSSDAPPTGSRPGGLTWIERQWDIRYLIYVDAESRWASTKRVSAKANAKRSNGKPGRQYFGWEEFFSPEHLVKTRVPDALDNPNVAVVLIKFDKDGGVNSSHTDGRPLRGRINRLLEVGLSEGEALNDRFYSFGYWFLGMGDASTHWAPAVCNIYQQPDPATIKSDDYLYGKLFKPNEYTPLFGCREWAYQLYDNDRPYIDVTSYQPRSKGQPPKGYIRAFVGWARFGDSKPIIGLHAGDWYCLHDCPAGDLPGLIPDIHSWAKRFKWPAPLPPTKVPTFPDPPAKAGTYPYEQAPMTITHGAE